MLRISSRGRQGIKALSLLARRFGTGPVTVREISELHDMPVPFLEQVLHRLKKEGLVKSRRGVGGGYILSRPPGDITIGDTVRALDGPIAACECFSSSSRRGKATKRMATCPIADVSRQLTKKIEAAFDSITLEDVIAEEKDGTGA